MRTDMTLSSAIENSSRLKCLWNRLLSYSMMPLHIIMKICLRLKVFEKQKFFFTILIMS